MAEVDALLACRGCGAEVVVAESAIAKLLTCTECEQTGNWRFLDYLPKAPDWKKLTRLVRKYQRQIYKARDAMAVKRREWMARHG